jgi:predicted RNA binding protein YcfA (HicA-like mRNA interferase family)
MKVRDLIIELKRRGWELDRIQGSHHIFVHPRARRAIPAAIHGKEISDFKAKKILKQSADALPEEG